MTQTKQITDFQVTWTADHEQYYQGHGIAFTSYTHSATGCGGNWSSGLSEELRETYAYQWLVDNYANKV